MYNINYNFFGYNMSDLGSDIKSYIVKDAYKSTTANSINGNNFFIGYIHGCKYAVAQYFIDSAFESGDLYDKLILTANAVQGAVQGVIQGIEISANDISDTIYNATTSTIDEASNLICNVSNWCYDSYNNLVGGSQEQHESNNQDESWGLIDLIDDDAQLKGWIPVGNDGQLEW